MWEEQAIAVFCVGSIFCALSMIAVGLRIYARRLSGQGLDWSDYFIFFALVSVLRRQ